MTCIGAFPGDAAVRMPGQGGPSPTCMTGGRDGKDQEEGELRLDAWIGNQRSRAATLSPERVEQLSSIGMRWT
ncbi:helicase associated domain-containing protein [Streptomyces sp. NPDC053069]|uniref:helicase associated domain-containing protein n=1 Tax=Streptomyces sp. NPDC053069 TaxID=3365695 RepID=UPI0037CD587F